MRPQHDPMFIVEFRWGVPEKFLIVTSTAFCSNLTVLERSQSIVELAEGRAIRVVEDHYASPTYAPPLAARCIDLVEGAPFGLYHVGGGCEISWYAYALMIFAEAGIQAEITPTNHREYVTPARRPRYSVLSNAKMESAGVAAMPPLKLALGEYLKNR